MNCPIEILSLIAKTLDPTDRAALALTCKASLANLGKASLTILRHPKNRMALLKLLFRMTKEFPNHYLCQDCIIFHSKHMAYHDYTGANLVVSEGYVVPHSVLRNLTGEFTNEKDLRKAVRSLSSVWTESRTTSDAQRWTVKVEASEKEDRLFLAVRYITGISIANQASPRLQSVPTCIHLKNPSTLIDACQSSIEDTPKPWDPPRSLLGWDGTVYRCPFCPTEYSVYTSPIHQCNVSAFEGARFLLTFIQYVELGSMRDSHTKELATLTRGRPAGVVADVAFDLDGRGSIAKRFMLGQGRTLTAKMTREPVPPVLD